MRQGRAEGGQRSAAREGRSWGGVLKRLFAATLVRRVVLALLLAFVLVWPVLLVLQINEVDRSEDVSAELRAFGADAAALLSTLDDAGQARAALAAIDVTYNGQLRLHEISMRQLYQLFDRRSGAAVYLSDGAPTQLMPSEVSGYGHRTINGRRHRVFSADTARWSLRIALPALDKGWLLQRIGGDLARYMLIALPLVLLPVVLAARQGLRPLRQLSERIAARRPDDLSALGVVPRHAELKPLAEALDRLLAQLREKVEREQAFVHDAAHELKTPMAVIAAQGHVLAAASDELARREAGPRLDRAIGRASHLVDQLLLLARVDGGGAGVQQDDIAQRTRQMLADLGPAALARDIDLTLDAPDALPAALDLQAYQSVVHNLVDNAIRYGRPGGRVAVELVPEPAGLRLAVRDDGPGIAPEHRLRVFERFHRGAGHESPGSGLGLAIAKQAVQRLGGRIELGEGLDGRGAGFLLWLPVAG